MRFEFSSSFSGRLGFWLELVPVFPGCQSIESRVLRAGHTDCQGPRENVGRLGPASPLVGPRATARGVTVIRRVIDAVRGESSPAKFFFKSGLLCGLRHC